MTGLWIGAFTKSGVRKEAIIRHALRLARVGKVDACWLHLAKCSFIHLLVSYKIFQEPFTSVILSLMVQYAARIQKHLLCRIVVERTGLFWQQFVLGSS